MSRQLFELCGKDKNKRFSPFVWRTRLALCQKGLSFEGVPTTFVEKHIFAPSGSKTVPVLKEGETWISDSWDIALYLEKTYPKKPSLFGKEPGEAFSRFFKFWYDNTIMPRIFVLIIPDIYKQLSGKSAEYFYKYHSESIDKSLEETTSLREKNLPRLKAAALPLRVTLSEKPFVAGTAPLYPDFIAFSAFKWAALCSPLDLLEDEPEIKAWFDRIDQFYREKIVDLETVPLL